MSLHPNRQRYCLDCGGITDDPYGGPCSDCVATYDDEVALPRRPIETVHLPAEDVTP